MTNEYLVGDRWHQPPFGWWCAREPLHDGPCAGRPRWWNIGPAARAFRKAYRR